MKQTLLEVTQSILSSLNSDNVNSITDTEEAEQVAEIIKQVYFEIISDRDWPHLQKQFKLDASGDSDAPTHLKMPETIQTAEYIAYDVRETASGQAEFREVTYCYPDEFLKKVMQRDSTGTNIKIVTSDSQYSSNTTTLIEGTILVYNDRAPKYWTSFDDEWIVMDAYDSTLDSTLQSHKTQCLGTEEPNWSTSDTYQIELPTPAFSYLLAEAKSVAWFEINETSNQKAEQQSRRQRTYLSVNKRRADHGIRSKINFGRK